MASKKKATERYGLVWESNNQEAGVNFDFSDVIYRSLQEAIDDAKGSIEGDRNEENDNKRYFVVKFVTEIVSEPPVEQKILVNKL